eukprot:Sspe_Gene.95840::Locus_68156_Transcript_1_1_Confidence_1.000_Length_790::g.95840::m.95840
MQSYCERNELVSLSPDTDPATGYLFRRDSRSNFTFRHFDWVGKSFSVGVGALASGNIGRETPASLLRLRTHLHPLPPGGSVGAVGSSRGERTSAITGSSSTTGVEEEVEER